MTICIAALCDDGKACVIATDRQITAPALSLEFEHADKKIDDLPGCVAMSSGDALLAAQIIQRTRESFGGAQPKVQEVAERLRDTFKGIHLQRAEGVILHPRGYGLQEFKERGAAQLPPQVYVTIDQMLFNFGIGVVEFLVAGVDSSIEAHIFRIHYSGMVGGDWLEWCDRLGYRAIGSGSLHASISLAIEDQHRRLSVAETLYNVFAAKKNSEVAPGVGSATDMMVLTAGKSEPVTPDRMKRFEGLREKTRREKPAKKELEAI